MGPNHKYKILLVHNYYQIPGGEDTVVSNEKRLLEEHGNQVIVYTRDNDELKRMNMIRRLVLPITTVFNPKSYRDIKRIIREEKIEIVHVHNTLNLISPSVYYASVKMKVPVVQTIHNFRFLCPGATFYRDGHVCEDCVDKGLGCAIKHKCYRDNRIQTLICVIGTWIHRHTGILKKINFICLTEFNKKKLMLLRQISSDEIYVRPNYSEGVISIVPPDERLNQYVYVGRLDKLKGVEILLQAWSDMGKNAPVLLVYGKGPLEKWCREYITTKECNIELRGYVPNEDIKRIIAKSKALILPSKWYEGFPMTIVEAYSAGTPVIGSNFGNVGELILEGKTGYKFDSSKQLADIVTGGINCDIYQTTHNHYRKNYEKEVSYSNLMSIYNAIESHNGCRG